jgi:hypothetical protein
MFLGLYYFVSSKKLQPLFPYWLLFTLASPIAAALTTEEIPSSVRPFSLVVPLTFLIALGIMWLYSTTKSWLRVGIFATLIILYIWSVAFFLEQLFVQMPIWRPWHRSRDYDITAQRIVELENDYKTVVISDDLREMYVYMWMNGLIDIADIQAQPLARYSDEYRIGKFIFTKDHCGPKAAEPDMLLVTVPGCEFMDKKGFVFVENTLFDDEKTKAFSLFRDQPPQPQEK